RPGVQQPLSFDITRGNISLHTVESDYMIDDQTGYIRLSRFAVSSYEEFVEAVQRLKDQGMERLILDLRDNPGGVMETAVRMVDEMLDAGKTIVYTQSRTGQFDVRHVSREGGMLIDEPIIVLVSPYSASASEIVAGALQDHDRGLIVGQRTFGKGLVQQQFTLPDGSVLQMTVSRYYTPSGRLIQTPYTNGSAEEYYEEKFASLEEATYEPAEYLSHLPDSLKFSTAHGRTVFGGGGILPDHVVAPDTASTFWPIVRKGLDMMFVREWFGAREAAMRAEWAGREDEFRSSFDVGDEMWESFLAFVPRKQAELAAEAETPAPEEETITATQLTENRAELEILLKARLARQIFGARASYPIYNQLDPTITQAMKLWTRALDLAEYHR
ncbi:MAG TPA: S41 family peptidase, partial [Rhodothermales bacterium]